MHLVALRHYIYQTKGRKNYDEQVPFHVQSLRPFSITALQKYVHKAHKMFKKPVISDIE